MSWSSLAGNLQVIQIVVYDEPERFYSQAPAQLAALPLSFIVDQEWLRSGS